MQEIEISKKPYVPLISWIAIGLALAGFGYRQYSEVKKVITTGGTPDVDELTDTMYKLTGTTGILIAWGVIAVCCFIFGYQQYKSRMK